MGAIPNTPTETEETILGKDSDETLISAAGDGDKPGDEDKPEDDGDKPGGEDKPGDEDKPKDDGDKPGDEDKPKDDGDKPGDEDKPKDDGDKSKNAPEKYEDFILPEGVELNKELTSKFTVLAKELNLSQENAQKIMDLASEQAQRFGDKNSSDVKEATKVWAEQTSNDKELGGAKLKENMSIAHKAIKHFGSMELQKIFNESGLGNHPELIRFAFKVGKAMSEDTIITGKGVGDKKPKSHANIIYPDNV